VKELAPTKEGVRRFLMRNRPGDKIERITRAIGIKPCGGCMKRKRLLNGEWEKIDGKQSPATMEKK
jgi:hypothetical protein